MIEDSHIKLLTDLLKLIEKHGEHSFYSLAKALRDPEFQDDMTTILEETPKIIVSKKFKTRPKKNKKISNKLQSEPIGNLQQWSDIILTQPPSE